MVCGKDLEILSRDLDRSEGSRLRAPNDLINKCIQPRIASRIRVVNITGEEGDRDTKRIRDQLQFVIFRLIFTT